MKSILNYIKSYTLQVLLAITAFFSWIETKTIGDSYNSASGVYEKQINGEGIDVGTSVAVTSGYTGGALAMGLICCVCIVTIVWIEINKKSH